MKANKKNYPQVFISEHPLIAHKLTLLRDKNTPSYLFRALLNEISLMLVYEATQSLVTQSKIVTTPLEKDSFEKLVHLKPSIIPILRAGLSMVEAFLTLIPTAKVGHIGLFRNEETIQSQCYYIKVPQNIAEGPVFICDPMLATGGSAQAAIDIVKAKGAKDISLINIIAAPEGLEKITKAHPEVTIYLGQLDRELNKDAFIVPGLGDAGDRYCGTFE